MDTAKLSAMQVSVMTGLGMTGYLSMLSELVLLTCLFVFKLHKSTLNRMIVGYCIIQPANVIAYTVAYVGYNCIALFIGFQFLTPALWVLSTCMAVNIYLCSNTSISEVTLGRVQYLLYFLIFLIPFALCVGVAGKFSYSPAEVNTRLVCDGFIDYQLFTNLIPFFVFLSAVLVLTALSFHKLYKTLQKSTKNITFFSVLLVVLGFYRVLAIPNMVYLLYNTSAPFWSAGLNIFAYSTEGLLVVIAVAVYYRIPRLIKESIKARAIITIVPESSNVIDKKETTTTAEL